MNPREGGQGGDLELVGERLPCRALLLDTPLHEGGPHFVTDSGINIKARIFDSLVRRWDLKCQTTAPLLD